MSYENGVGKNHASYATALSNMAAVYFNLRKYPEAQQTYEAALAIRHAILPADHQDVAMNLYQLAACKRQLQHLDEAESLGTDALTRLKRKYGTEHGTVAAAMNALALTLKAKAVAAHTQHATDPAIAGWLDRAKTLLETACATRYNTQGPKHPDYVATCYNLSTVYELAGDTTRAERVRAHIMSIFGEQTNVSPSPSSS